MVGAGFAGLELAKKLSGDSRFLVDLIDRRNYHLFQPLLYQVAMAGLSSTDIAIPIRSLFKSDGNVQVVMDEITQLDLNNQRICGASQSWSYDFLILACGAQHSYFGQNQWEPHAPGLKTIEQAIEIRRRILSAFELAERSSDPSEIGRLLTFVVVGGGPTGVELAGAIGEISQFTLSRDFKKLLPSKARIILIEGGDRILNSFDPSLSQKAQEALKKLGVEVWCNRRVTEVTQDGVVVDQDHLSCGVTLWAAGVQASKLNQQLPGHPDSGGRIEINPDLSIQGHENVFVLGDQMLLKDANGKPLPGIAPVALQQGRYLAKVLKAKLRFSKNTTKVEPFRYIDKGQMATIGRKMAVLQMGGFKLWGFVAWLAWLFVHIYYLIGFKNRLFVLAQWAWHYFSYARGARLILEQEWRSFYEKK